MQVYKSSIQQKPSNMQKKSSINFIKTVASPKTYKQQQYGSQKYFSSQMTSQHSSHKVIQKIYQNLNLIIHPIGQTSSGCVPINTRFQYNSQTQIKNLISFVHDQISNNIVYFKCNNMHLDYLLTLKDYYIKDMVKEMQSKQMAIQIQLKCFQFKHIDQTNALKNYQIVKCVGSGGFSKVYLVRAYGKLMAMKTISKQFILSNEKSNIIMNQKSILTACSCHPFITTLYSSFQTSSFLIFVMQFCNGGQLFNLLRKVRRMSQIDAKFYFLQTLSAISYLHKKGIVYRDIKPENIIIDCQGHVRLADYGLSKIMDDNRQSKTYSFCGSAQYMAPEMLLKKGHSYQIDFYCLGALLYELVIGLPPYYSRNQNQLFSNIINNQLQFPGHIELSTQLKSFLEHLLQKQIDNRYQSLQQILSHPWLSGIRMEDVFGKKLKPPYKTDMFEYNFDDSDFAAQQEEITHNLINDQSNFDHQDIKFPDFFYQAKEIVDMRNIINNSKQKGIFIRSIHNNVGSFNAQKQSRQVSKSPSGIFENSRQISINQNSRQHSTNRMQISSNIISFPATSENSRRLNVLSPPRYTADINKIGNYSFQKNPLHQVRSVEHLNQMKTLMNRSNQSANSSRRLQANYNTNIYTQKANFHSFGIKVAPSSILNIGTNQSHKTSYTRQPAYYSVDKSSQRPSTRLDIRDLTIKNQRNYSVEKSGIYSSPNINRSHTTLYQHTINNSSFKDTVLTNYEKKSFLDGFKDRIAPSKVKKTSFKNGEKISLTMLNNNHYRN